MSQRDLPPHTAIAPSPQRSEPNRVLFNERSNRMEHVSPTVTSPRAGPHTPLGRSGPEPRAGHEAPPHGVQLLQKTPTATAGQRDWTARAEPRQEPSAPAAPPGAPAQLDSKARDPPPHTLLRESSQPQIHLPAEPEPSEPSIRPLDAEEATSYFLAPPAPSLLSRISEREEPPTPSATGTSPHTVPAERHSPEALRSPELPKPLRSPELPKPVPTDDSQAAPGLSYEEASKAAMQVAAERAKARRQQEEEEREREKERAKRKLAELEARLGPPPLSRTATSETQRPEPSVVRLVTPHI
jgi:hypothetical protein